MTDAACAFLAGFEEAMEADVAEPEPSVKPWAPHPGPQTDAYNCEADELFYGGAAGGGKTGLGVGLAITAHRRSILFRKTFGELDEIIEQLKEHAPAGKLNSNAGAHDARRRPPGRSRLHAPRKGQGEVPGPPA